MKQSESFSIANRLVHIVLCGGVIIGLAISLLFNILALNQPLDQIQKQLQQAMEVELQDVSLRSLQQHAIKPSHYQNHRHAVAVGQSPTVTLTVNRSQWQQPAEVSKFQVSQMLARYRYTITYFDIPGGFTSEVIRDVISGDTGGFINADANQNGRNLSSQRIYWIWDLQPLQHGWIYQIATHLSRDLLMVTLLITTILFGLHRRIIIPVQNFDASHQGVSIAAMSTEAISGNDINKEAMTRTNSANIEAFDGTITAVPEELQGVQQSLIDFNTKTQRQQQEKLQLQQQLIDLQQQLTARVRELEQQLKQLELSNDQLLKSNQFLQQDQLQVQLQDQQQDSQQDSQHSATYDEPLKYAEKIQADRPKEITQLAQLAAGIAHEINNPVAIVYSNIATLKEYVSELIELTEQYQLAEEAITNPAIAGMLRQLSQAMDFDFIQSDTNDLIQSSLKSLERVRHIVADLQTFTDGDVKPQEAVVIDDLVIEALKDVRSSPIIQISNVLMTLSPVYVVRDQVKVALQKVLANAIDSMPDGGNIEIAAVEERDNISVTIKDSGCGMSQEALSHATEPFFTQKEIGQGIGLGLTVAHNLIRHQGGQLLIDSNQGNGTMVTMNFPCMSLQ